MPIFQLSSLESNSNTYLDYVNVNDHEINTKQREVAERRYKIIEPLVLLKLKKGCYSKQDVIDVAENNKIGVATIYRWLNRYKVRRQVVYPNGYPILFLREPPSLKERTDTDCFSNSRW